MNKFTKNISPYVQSELDQAKQFRQQGSYQVAFSHLENAHVLGQESTYWHVKVHYLMLLWGVEQKDMREILGQIIRIVGAFLFTAIKGVPTGNTGGSNVSAIKRMPIKPEYLEIIKIARH